MFAVTILKLVPPAGVEPTLTNYLLHTGYKSAVLPLNYRGIFGAQGGTRTHDFTDLQSATLAALSPVHTNLAVRLRLELRTRLSPSDGLAIRSNTIIGPHHCCIVLLWITITLLSFAFNVSTYMEYPSILDPLSLRLLQA